MRTDLNRGTTGTYAGHQAQVQDVLLQGRFVALLGAGQKDLLRVRIKVGLGTSEALALV